MKNPCVISWARVQGINHLISHTIPSPAPASCVGQSEPEPPLAPVSSGPGPESDTGLRTDSGSDHRRALSGISSLTPPRDSGAEKIDMTTNRRFCCDIKENLSSKVGRERVGAAHSSRTWSRRLNLRKHGDIKSVKCQLSAQILSVLL